MKILVMCKKTGHKIRLDLPYIAAGSAGCGTRASHDADTSARSPGAATDAARAVFGKARAVGKATSNVE